MKLRPYQVDAVNKGVEFFLSDRDGGALMVEPTGSGKSIVIANIALKIGGNTLILQPSKELLEQNYAKMCLYMGTDDIGIYSASAGRKDFGKITFATIGSIVNRKEEFKHFDQIIIDECHLVNSQQGRYEQLIKALQKPVLGLTATPYRLYTYNDIRTDMRAVVAKFLHRTRPRIFNKVIHITQISELYEQKYLCPLDYSHSTEGYDRTKIKLNSTGMDFDQESLMLYHMQVNVVETVAKAIQNSEYKHILVFASSVLEAERIAVELKYFNVACVSSKTKASDREKILTDFKSGKIRVVTNVGVLTTGFDFPELDCIILARPTQSVALYYQMLGRGLRIAPGKQKCFIIDVCGNVQKFGKIETFEIVEPKKGLHRMKSNTNFLTGYDFLSGEDLEESNYKNKSETSGFKKPEKKLVIFPFGKYKGTHLTAVDINYLRWIKDNFDPGYIKDACIKELERRDNNQ